MNPGPLDALQIVDGLAVFSHGPGFAAIPYEQIQAISAVGKGRLVGHHEFIINFMGGTGVMTCDYIDEAVAKSEHTRLIVGLNRWLQWKQHS